MAGGTGQHVAHHRAFEMHDGALVVAVGQNLTERPACGSVVRDARDDIVEERQRRLFAVEVEDDLGTLPGHFNITVGGHRGELAQPRPASGRTSVALVPVAGYPLAPGAVERGRERLES